MSSLGHDTTSTVEFPWKEKGCFHSLLSCMLICDQMQSWFELWVLKSRHVNCFKSRILFSPLLPCSPSYSRSPVESAWRTFFCESPRRLSQLVEQPNCLEICAGSEAHRTRWLSPPSPRAEYRRPLQLRCADNDSSSPSPHLCVWAAVASFLRQPPAPPSLASFLSSSTPVLCSHSCDWLVSHGFSPVTLTQWCFGCSSGKQASMFVLFLLLPRLKYHGTKLHTGLALQDPGKEIQNKIDLKKRVLCQLPYSIKVG